MKKRLLHIALGTHNQYWWKALDKEFQCFHFDWTPYQAQPALLNQKILEIARVFKPEVVFMQIQGANIIDKQTLVELKKIGAGE